MREYYNMTDYIYFWYINISCMRNVNNFIIVLYSAYSRQLQSKLLIPNGSIVTL